MKEYKVYSDAGGILVGTRDCRVHIPNAYGDGITKVRVFDQRRSRWIQEPGWVHN